MADKADSGTKGFAVRALNSNNNHRACLRSTGFAEESRFLRLAGLGLSIGFISLPDEDAPGASLSC